MLKTLPTGLIALLCCLILISPLSIKADDNLVELVRGNNELAFKIFNQLKGTQGNLFFSPYSISTALAMTTAGAAGETQEEMKQAMSFTLDDEALHPAFSKFDHQLKEIENKGKVELAVANSLWPHKEYPFRREYISLIEKYYGTSVTPVDYMGKTEDARLQINSWVEERTRERIKDLIEPDVLTIDTRLVLVNAIFFKGDWKNSFDAEATKNEPFHISSETSLPVKMMSQKNHFPYAKLPGFQILELPYVGNDLSMLILLPDSVDGMSQLESRVSAADLSAWKTVLRNVEVDLSLPRFKFSWGTRSLVEPLKRLGMKKAFGPGLANFSRMDGRKDLYIDDILHQAFIEVNEQGTEAAAATAVVARPQSFSVTPRFRADRPFLFTIQENASGAILFMGRVSDPTSAKGEKK